MVAAAPGITDEEKAAIAADIEKLANSDAWKQELATSGWADPFLAGADFEAQLAADIEATDGDPHRHRPGAMSAPASHGAPPRRGGAGHRAPARARWRR